MKGHTHDAPAHHHASSHLLKEYREHPSLKTLGAALGSTHPGMVVSLSSASSASRQEDWFSPQRFLFGYPDHSTSVADLEVARQYACVAHICWHTFQNPKFTTKDQQGMRGCVCTALTDSCRDNEEHGSALCAAVRKMNEEGMVTACPVPGKDPANTWQVALNWAESQGEYFKGKGSSLAGGFGAEQLPAACRHFLSGG